MTVRQKLHRLVCAFVVSSLMACGPAFVIGLQAAEGECRPPSGNCDLYDSPYHPLYWYFECWKPVCPEPI